MGRQSGPTFKWERCLRTNRWPYFAVSVGQPVGYAPTRIARTVRGIVKAGFGAMLLCAGAHANVDSLPPPRHVDLYCHRTANEDVPENTLESLEQAALLGCDVVEIDIRRTADGVLVLNHDGFLERLTDGSGEVESSLYDDLRTRDAGSWMNPRFAGLHITTFRAALSFARDHNVRLNLDVKTEGLGPDILNALRREGMQDRVSIGGDWEDLREIRKQIARPDNTIWKQPGITKLEIEQLHREGKAVIVNFSANAHAMDILSMRAAVAAGADGINVDFPRLGADAVERPVQQRLSTLADQAKAGDPTQRVNAILELSRFRGFNLTPVFLSLVSDPEPLVSRAAAVSLVNTRPVVSASLLRAALQASSAASRANAAWALGQIGAPSSMLLPLLSDPDPQVLEQTLVALARLPGSVPGNKLLPLLSNANPAVRGAAALALAQHDPKLAATAIPKQLREDIRVQRLSYDAWAHRGKPQLTPAEIKPITDGYRSQMQQVKALASLHDGDALPALEEQAFRNTEDFSQVNGLVAAFQLWGRIAAVPAAAIEALGSSDTGAADRAEWMLVQAGPAVLPAVRKALEDANPEARVRLVRILAWQNDTASIAALNQQASRHTVNVALIQWAIEKLNATPAPEAK